MVQKHLIFRNLWSVRTDKVGSDFRDFMLLAFTDGPLSKLLFKKLLVISFTIFPVRRNKILALH